MQECGAGQGCAAVISKHGRRKRAAAVARAVVGQRHGQALAPLRGIRLAEHGLLLPLVAARAHAQCQHGGRRIWQQGAQKRAAGR